MHVIGREGARQSDLWKRLNVVRSAICEMVRALQRLGWLTRVRAADSRTWLVRLTKRGRGLFERAYDEWVDSGVVTVHVDAALCEGHVESNVEAKRLEILYACEALDAAFRAQQAGNPYFWDPADYYAWFTDADERFGDIPFADVSAARETATMDGWRRSTMLRSCVTCALLRRRSRRSSRMR